MLEKLQENVSRTEKETSSFHAKEQQYLQDIAALETQLNATQSENTEKLVASQRRVQDLLSQLAGTCSIPYRYVSEESEIRTNF